MAKYYQMCQASLDAAERFQQYRERVLKYASKVRRALILNCAVPQDKITLFKCNEKTDEERQNVPVDEEILPTLQRVLERPESDGYWHLGIQITLSQMHFVSLVLCFSEDGGSPIVRIGQEGKGEAIDLDDQQALASFCESIGDIVVAAYGDTRASTSRSIGFGATY